MLHLLVHLHQQLSELLIALFFFDKKKNTCLGKEKRFNVHLVYTKNSLKNNIENKSTV